MPAKPKPKLVESKPPATPPKPATPAEKLTLRDCFAAVRFTSTFRMENR